MLRRKVWFWALLVLALHGSAAPREPSALQRMTAAGYTCVDVGAEYLCTDETGLDV